MFPWRLTALVDSRLQDIERSKLAQAFLCAQPCCLDTGFTTRLKSLAGTGYSMDDLLQPNGSMRPLLEVMSLHKPVNSEIENNFARAVSASKCSRGAGKTFSCFVSVSVLCCVDTFKPGHCQLFLKPF